MEQSWPGTPVDWLAADGANTPMYAAVHSPAFYDAGLNKTFVAWEAWTGVRSEQVTALDHSTGYFSDVEGAGRNFMVDDDHGNPTIVLDHENHLHCFYGSHANVPPTGMHHSSTRWPWDGTPLDAGSKWEIRPKIEGLLTYPHPVMVGSTMYLLIRDWPTGLSTLNTIALYKTTALANGAATWGSNIQLLDMGAGTRIYQGTALAVGTDIHFVCNKANGDSTVREHIYYLVYDTVTGALCNHDKSFSVASGSLPMTLAQANANCRIFEHASGNSSYCPVLAFDTNGDPFVATIDGPAAGSTFDLKVLKRTAGVWGSPETVGTIVNGSTYSHGLIGPLADGRMEALWISDPDNLWTARGGNVYRRTRSAAGVWGTPHPILIADTRALNSLNAVKNAHVNARITFCEVAPDVLDSSAGGARVYLWGEMGLLPYRQAPEAAIVTDEDGNELREDSGLELREDDTIELREVPS